MIRYLSALVAVAVLAMTATSGAAPRANPGDIVEINQLQATFQRAASTRNLGLMMSLWADDATLSVPGTEGLEGKDQIRYWFAVHSEVFRPGNRWVSLTASPKTQINVQGNQASLAFDCHFVDVTTKEVKADVAVTTTLARIQGKWRIKDAIFGPANL